MKPEKGDKGKRQERGDEGKKREKGDKGKKLEEGVKIRKPAVPKPATTTPESTKMRVKTAPLPPKKMEVRLRVKNATQ
jgi:hypothetical protein